MQNISGSLQEEKLQAASMRKHKKARNSDGENPANQINKTVPAVPEKKEKRFPSMSFPVKPAIPEKKERCIPLKART